MRNDGDSLTVIVKSCVQAVRVPPGSGMTTAFPVPNQAGPPLSSGISCFLTCCVHLVISSDNQLY